MAEKETSTGSVTTTVTEAPQAPKQYVLLLRMSFGSHAQSLKDLNADEFMKRVKSEMEKIIQETVKQNQALTPAEIEYLNQAQSQLLQNEFGKLVQSIIQLLTLQPDDNSEMVELKKAAFEEIKLWLKQISSWLQEQMKKINDLNLSNDKSWEKKKVILQSVLQKLKSPGDSDKIPFAKPGKDAKEDKPSKPQASSKRGFFGRSNANPGTSKPSNENNHGSVPPPKKTGK